MGWVPTVIFVVLRVASVNVNLMLSGVDVISVLQETMASVLKGAWVSRSYHIVSSQMSQVIRSALSVAFYV